MGRHQQGEFMYTCSAKVVQVSENTVQVQFKDKKEAIVLNSDQIKLKPNDFVSVMPQNQNLVILDKITLETCDNVWTW